MVGGRRVVCLVTLLCLLFNDYVLHRHIAVLQVLKPNSCTLHKLYYSRGPSKIWSVCSLRICLFVCCIDCLAKSRKMLQHFQVTVILQGRQYSYYHLRVWCGNAFGCVCLFCSGSNFWELWPRNFIFTSSEHLGHVRISRSSGQGQGHRSQ